MICKDLVFLVLREHRFKCRIADNYVQYFVYCLFFTAYYNKSVF